jgi:biotin operon repressor
MSCPWTGPYDESPARPGRCSQKGPTHDDPTRGDDPAATGQAPVERQHRLIEELRRHRGRHATAEDLAAALGVDVRTVERDITRLRTAGVPITARRGPGGGFRLDVPPSVPPVHLSPGEIAALVVSVTAVGP